MLKPKPFSTYFYPHSSPKDAIDNKNLRIHDNHQSSFFSKVKKQQNYIPSLITSEDNKHVINKSYSVRCFDFFPTASERLIVLATVSLFFIYRQHVLASKPTFWLWRDGGYKLFLCVLIVR